MNVRYLSWIFLVTSFIPLAQANSLKEVYQQALENNAEFQSARASYKAGSEQSRIARSALLPQLSLNGQYSDTRVRSSGDTLFSNTDDQVGQYGANLSQAIFNLSAWNTWKQGKALSASSSAQFTQAQQDLILLSAEVYFNVLRAVDNLRSGRAEEKANEQQLRQTKERFEVGLVAITDVHESQASYDAVLAQRLGFEADLGVAFEALSNFTGSPWNAVAALKPEFKVSRPEPLDPMAWVKLAEENSPSLAAARYASEAAARAAKSAKAAHLPTLTGSVSYGKREFDQVNDGTEFDRFDDETTTYLLSMNLPLYLGGGLHAQRRQAAYQAQQASADLLGTERNLKQQVRSLHLTVNTNVARVKAGRQGVVSSQSALDATREGYKAGTRNTVDLLFAQQNLYRAQRDSSNFLYDYILNMLRLKQAAGVLLVEDLEMLDSMLNEAKNLSR